MDNQPSAPAANPRRRFQFTLRHLMELTTVSCLFCALWAWSGEMLGFGAEGFLILGIVLFAAGFFMKRLIIWFSGLVVLGVLLVQFFPFIREKNSPAPQINECVEFSLVITDSVTNEHIAGATVSLTNPRSKKLKKPTNKTNAIGRVKLSDVFPAKLDPTGGQYRSAETASYIPDMKGAYLEIEKSDYHSMRVDLPLQNGWIHLTPIKGGDRHPP